MKNFVFWIILLLLISGIQIVIFPDPTFRTAIEFSLNILIGFITIIYIKIIYSNLFLMKNFVFWIILLLSISGIQIVIFPGPTIRTVIEFSLNILIGFIIINYSKIIYTNRIPLRKLINVYIIYSIIVFIHSAIISRSYEQWRYLLTVYTPFLFLPSFIYICLVPQYTKTILKTLLTISIPLSFTFFILGDMFNGENVFYVKYTSFIYVFILILPYLKAKWKILVFIISILSLFFNLDNRTNILCIFISYLFSIFFYYFDFKALKKIMRFIFLATPLFFLLMGSIGAFNIFSLVNDEKSFSIESGNKEIVLTTDSRTTIYNDAFNNLNKKNSWIFGVGVTDIYKTQLSEVLSFFEKGRLGASESAFLNYLSYGGILFVVIVFLLFYKISYLAIYRSNNSIIQIFGVFLCFEWFLIFIENPIDINFYWVSSFAVMGICLSPEFRRMNNKQIFGYLKMI